MSLFEVKFKFPLIKKIKNQNYLTPKLSLRFNPSDMKNHIQPQKKINTDNIFILNRLGLE